MCLKTEFKPCFVRYSLFFLRFSLNLLHAFHSFEYIQGLTLPMKISSVVPEFSPVSAHYGDSSESPNPRVRLRFPDPAMEADFQDFLTRSAFISEADLYLVMPTATAGICCLSGVSYVYDSLSQGEFETVGQYQLYGLGVCMAVGSVILVAAYRCRHRKTVESALWALLWLGSSFWFSLLSTSVLSSLISTPTETQSFPGATPILLMSLIMLVIFPCRSLPFAFISLTSLLIYTAINFCVQSRPRERVVLEFFLLLLFELGGLYVMLRYEKAVRRAYAHESVFEQASRVFTPSAQLPPTSLPPSSDIHSAVHSIRSALLEASAHVSLLSVRVKLQQAITDLEFCASHLKNIDEIDSEKKRMVGVSVQTVEMMGCEGKEEGIGVNMDEEDKEFVKQNYMQSKASEYEKEGDRAVPVAVSIESWAAEYQLNELQAVLSQLGKNWNFDIFFLEEVTKGKALSVSGRYSLLKYDINTKHRILDFDAQSFFTSIEGKYKPNPYHNSCHGADVMNSTLFLLLHSDLAERISSLEMLGVIVSTLCHDVGHGALTNRFLVNARDPLAILYNDMSVLEMMHASVTYTVLQEEGRNILKNLDNDSWMLVRKVVLKLILATGTSYADMSRHFDLLKDFRATHNSALCTDISSLDERVHILEVMIKCADIGHAAKSIELHEKWTLLVCEEFFQQGDLEKKMGLPVSAFCDRENTNIPKVPSTQSQMGFIQNIVLPLYEALHVYLNVSIIDEMCLQQLRTNMSTWERILKRKRRFTHYPGDGEESRPISDYEALVDMVRGRKRG